MDKRYEFSNCETKWYKYWEDKGLFHSEPSKNEAYTIILPPPNASGSLHLGHALNSTIQDILIRYYKMKGFNTLFLPGYDHGGISSASTFEKELIKQGLSKHKMCREEFTSRLFDWALKNKTNITNQLKRIGCAFDWPREQYTINEHFSKWVLKAFIQFYNDGMIYKGKYIVNWCARCATALSDDEVTYKENMGKMYYLKYKFADNDNENEYLTVATTRPETIFGDVAIAFNPLDERYNKLEGKEVYVPIINRKIKLIKDNEVSMTLGTGLVKITPAHDKFDYSVGKKNNLETLVILDERCKICNTNTKYDGMDRFKCREDITKELQGLGLIEKIEQYKNNIAECYRCQTVIEPYLSNQWFLKMEPLIELAQKAVNNGEVEFIPDYQTKTFNVWTNKNIDWCISRTVWWGHRLPIWYCSECSEIICQETAPTECNKCHSDKLKRDESVLDTWFSSALWAFGVFEKEEDFNYYYPIETLVTGKDILYFWVTKMIMFSLYFTGKVPFKRVLLHGLVRDGQGDKMSKSKGNGINPLDIMDKYGADALRYTLIFNLPLGSDINVSLKSFDLGKVFCTKLWNATRYILMNIQENEIEAIKNNISDINDFDKWILYKLDAVNSKMEKFIAEYNFSNALKDLGGFFWDDFCNMYLEIAKNYVNDISTKQILLQIISKILRLYHPVIPFLTEELWSYIRKYFNDLPESIMDAKWPENDITVPTKLNETQYFVDQIYKTRATETDNKKVVLTIENESNAQFLEAHKEAFCKLTKMDELTIK